MAGPFPGHVGKYSLFRYREIISGSKHKSGRGSASLPTVGVEFPGYPKLEVFWVPVVDRSSYFPFCFMRASAHALSFRPPVVDYGFVSRDYISQKAARVGGAPSPQGEGSGDPSGR